MDEHIKNIIDFASQDKVAEMQDSVMDAIKQKIEDAFALKKVEVASAMFNPVKESWDDEDEDPDVARAEKELKKQKVKLPKVKADPDKDFEKLAKKEKKEVDEGLDESDSLTKGMKLVSKHGDGKYTAKVYYSPDWEEHQVHFYKDGNHMGEGPVSYHSGNGKKEDREEAQHSAVEGLKRFNVKKDVHEGLDEVLDTLEKVQKYRSKAISQSMDDPTNRTGIRRPAMQGSAGGQYTKDDLRKLRNRKKGLQTAEKKLEKIRKEDVELEESYEVGHENKSSHDGTVWHSVSHKGIPIGTIGTNAPQYQEKHGKWGFEDQAGNGRKQNEPKLNSKKDALNALMNRHNGMLNQSKNEGVEHIEELSKELTTNYIKKAGKSLMSLQNTFGRDEEEKRKRKSKFHDRVSGLERAYNKLAKEDFSEILEKLDPSMGASKYIDDFVHSDNPKFKGKSKKERIEMALGAFYSSKKGK
jgi:small-conductance mechanosensitive channel